MLGTIIMDSYKSDEAKFLAGCIDKICSPNDSLGWSSAGIYSFWNYYTKEVLYIGLASDLSIRFKQHNGLLPIAENACKARQIQEYFLQHEKLGYSILVQSPLHQPIVHRNEISYREFLESPKGKPIPNYVGEEGLETIRYAEGQLIESYKQEVGTIPPWNKIGGDVRSRKRASKNSYQNVVKAFASGTPNNHLISRSTIRELATNSDYEYYETHLHSLRSLMLTLSISFDDAVFFQTITDPYFQKEWTHLLQSEYLSKELLV